MPFRENRDSAYFMEKIKSLKAQGREREASEMAGEAAKDARGQGREIEAKRFFKMGISRHTEEISRMKQGVYNTPIFGLISAYGDLIGFCVRYGTEKERGHFILELEREVESDLEKIAREKRFSAAASVAKDAGVVFDRCGDVSRYQKFINKAIKYYAEEIKNCVAEGRYYQILDVNENINRTMRELFDRASRNIGQSLRKD